MPDNTSKLTYALQDARTWLPQLSALANSGLKILIWVSKPDNSLLILLKFDFTLGW